MRCPKCGFISFDHVDTCLKCNKDISNSPSELVGTTYNVAPPSFLKIQKGSERSREEDAGIAFDISKEESDVIDPDLDVLADDRDEDQDEDTEIAFGDEFEGFGSLPEEEDLEIAEDDEGEEGLDLGEFDDAFKEEEAPSDEEPALNMEMPDELADISDLSAPAPEPEDTETVSGVPARASSEDEEDDFSLELDLDDIENEEFSLTTEEDQTEDEEDTLGDLSLDDLGLSEAEEEKPAPKQKTKSERGKMDMDADLDFDLDLGGITLDSDDDEKESWGRIKAVDMTP